MRCTAHNERFCESGAVTPQKHLCKFGSLSPAGTVVEAPPSQSRHHVINNGGTVTDILKSVPSKDRIYDK